MTTTSWTEYAWDRHPVFVSTRRMLDVVFPEPRDGIRLVDLGCLNGGFSVELARLGFSVLGIEVRASNIAACREVGAREGLANLRFVQDDAWNLPAYGQFEVVFCSGLLYHLDRPRAFLEMLGRQCTRMLVLNTHVATVQPNLAFDLGDLEEHEGLIGRWYREYATEDEFERREDAPLSSWANRRSFWIERTMLLGAVQHAGFATVLEQLDQHEDIRTSLWQHGPGVYDRCQVIALKEGGR